MKYYKPFEDKTLFEKITPYKLARYLEITPSYLYQIKRGKLIISEEQYKRLREAVDRLEAKMR